MFKALISRRSLFSSVYKAVNDSLGACWVSLGRSKVVNKGDDISIYKKKEDRP